ncbi:UNVERIFIED_CONTAM: KH domain-containing protein [Sesamum angustifolium]|uniref:KH domain-containing protein n=1 Tax=Sesamum angustifolium TaxID=2727405 RepID=A0AAW2PDP1_9LAMI
MYKFTPKESIPLETTIPEAPPSIIIPSDVPIYPATGLYPSVDPINPARPVPSILGPSHAPDIPGYADAGTTWPLYSSALPVVSGYGGASRTEELFIKVLCPSNKIGRVIGKGGSSIKSIRQDSGARVEVEDRKSNHNECVITVISTESSDDLKSMAVEAVLLLQAKINDDDDDTVTMRLLVPSKVIGCIIGKSGSIINEIRKRTKADIRISKGEKPKCANENDELVEMGDNGYGSLSSHSSSLYAGLPPPSTLEMVIPAHAVGKVMGKGGTNIDNIRKISGAAVEISDSKSSRGDRVALISGTTEQKRAAENLIQAFIMAT